MPRNNVNPRRTSKAAENGSPGKFRRRPPSPTEQARREAWGRKWGQLVRDATRGITEGKR